MLSYFKYIKIPDFSGDIKSDVQNLLYLNNKPKTFEHVKAVADKNREIAKQYGLDLNICEICGYLHDISAIIPYNDMMAYAVDNNWHIYEAEKKIPMLLHPRISKIIAEQDFDITDEQILSAVECHATLKANPSAYDMALFVADKLAWDQESEPPFYNIVSDSLKKSLESASLAYMDYIVDNKMILYPHAWFAEGAKFLRNMIV
ncbi:MAG: HD domain-containing protein [Oscillospiraceae bacterium]|nr:HD domain-containing protein [Oscillospiraceae bacterium]